jgi:lipopolysaccharide biosynthesis glycosyltransferase
VAKLSLVLAIDSGFEELAAVALCSTLVHNALKQVVVVTPEGCQLLRLPEIARTFETKLTQIHVRKNSPIWQLSPDVAPYFYCVEALELCDAPGRYLYLDADTLCVASLAPLERLRLTSELPLGACSHGRPMADRQLVLRLDSAYHYFNAGVILFESAHLQSIFSCRDAVDYFIENEALCRFREQCAMNSILRGKVQYLPLQYNYLSWMRERRSDHAWHDPTVNVMAGCMEDARNNLAVVHLSAGALPTRVPAERLEPVDKYWLNIHDQITNGKDLRRLTAYSRIPRN